MYLNFCDFRLRPNIQCDAVCTDGYEVDNLIKNPEKGFLAYSAIKPPIHIEITFECSVRISHVLIWPSVGSQKSSGFILSTKTSTNDYEQYTAVAHTLLQSSDKGVLFYPGGTEPDMISTPPNFIKCLMKGSRPRLPNSIMSARVLRITITKTEKSVPALGKVEVWGTVSPICGPKIIEKVHSLLNPLPLRKIAPKDVVEEQQENQTDQRIQELFQIPEEFLDPITWQIMIQPILLPSGNIVDESTLKKFEQAENIWGRLVSDPFTGVPFDKVNSPILMPALKSRIDKFLLENSDRDEIKKMPRVLGYSSASLMARNRRLRMIPKCLQNSNSTNRTVKRVTSDACEQKTDNNNNNSQQSKRFCHQLPAIITRQSLSRQSNFSVAAKSRVQSPAYVDNNLSTSRLMMDYSGRRWIEDVGNNLSDNSTKKHLLNEEVTETVDSSSTIEKCKCCEDCILYMLPCKDTICRKQLLSAVYKQCVICGLSYKSSEVERVHIYM